eukprot:1159074-Pelagomonas_calceolata.AAC.10
MRQNEKEIKEPKTRWDTLYQSRERAPQLLCWKGNRSSMHAASFGLQISPKKGEEDEEEEN